MDTFIQDLINSYKFRIESAYSISQQKWLNVDEIAWINKRLAQCELLTDMISHYTNDDTYKIDFANKAKEIKRRLS